MVPVISGERIHCCRVIFLISSSDVEPELLKETGACMHITVMDYDVFSNDDIAGHVFFNLNNILGLREVMAGGFGNVPQETRNIFHPKPGGLYFEGKKLKLFLLLSFCQFCFHDTYCISQPAICPCWPGASSKLGKDTGN